MSIPLAQRMARSVPRSAGGPLTSPPPPSPGDSPYGRQRQDSWNSVYVTPHKQQAYMARTPTINAADGGGASGDVPLCRDCEPSHAGIQLRAVATRAHLLALTTALLISSSLIISFVYRDHLRALPRTWRVMGVLGVASTMLGLTLLRALLAFFIPRYRYRQPLAYHNFADKRCWCGRPPAPSGQRGARAHLVR